ncbi:MAG: transglutaminase domain-containing protein [Firmicutes bacterium]|nr:transglutaminase domain-containing protein [Bacillota bacterium]
MKIIYRSFCLLSLILCLTVPLIQADGRYTISDPQQYRIRYLVEVENTAGPAKEIEIELPVFNTDKLPPYQKLVFYQEPRGIKINKLAEGQNAVYLAPLLDKGRQITLEFKYTFVNYAIDYQPNGYKGYSSVEKRYLQSETGIESDSKTIVNLARNLTAGCDTQMDKARKLFEYVNTTFKYQKIEQDSHSALETIRIGKGVCEDFSLVYIALCRAARIPARLVRGYRFSANDLRSGETDLKEFAHAWVEVNLPAEGWITVEPTFTYSVNGIKQVSYDFFGKIDKTDRHLFFSYIRDNAPNCSWKHDPRNPANLKLTVRTLLRK